MKNTTLLVRKLWMGSVAEEIFRLAPCPVLMVGSRVSTAAAGLRTVLYATDFSAESMQALPYALSLARQFRGSLVAMHAVVTVVPEEEATSNRG